VAKAKALLILEMEAYEASALVAFLERHDDEFESPDLPGGEELQEILETMEETLPTMSYTPPIEKDTPSEDA
jgi:hypothetical protein